MKLVIIGAGNVATVLGSKWKEAGHRILQTVNRHTDLEAIDQGADCYILAVSDDSLRTIDLPLNDKLVVHTAGAVPMQILGRISDRHGVCYPLQSLKKDSHPYPAEIPLLIDAANDDDLRTIETLARSISPAVSRADDAKRLRLHLAAIFVNNFTNFLYTRAADYCQSEGMDFDLLKPLIKETTARLIHAHPNQVQTGPAVRGDLTTIGRHLELLTDYKDLQDMYRWFTGEIMHYYNVAKNRPV